jgi:hypothetical protein
MFGEGILLLEIRVNNLINLPRLSCVYVRVCVCMLYNLFLFRINSERTNNLTFGRTP